MKVTAYLIAAAIAAPAAILLGASATLVAGAAIAIGLTAIALGDYSRTPVTYDRELATTAHQIERHALAA